MFNSGYNALTWASLLLSCLNHINAASAQWGPWHFQIQPYLLLDFWTITPDYVTEFVLVLEQRPVNGRSAHYAQGLRQGPACDSGPKNSHTSVTSSSLITGETASLATASVVHGTTTLSSLSSTLSSSASSSSSISQSASTSPFPSLASSLVSSSSLSSTSSSTLHSSSASQLSSTTHPSLSATASTPSAASGVYGDSSLNNTNKGTYNPLDRASEWTRGHD